MKRFRSILGHYYPGVRLKKQVEDFDTPDLSPIDRGLVRRVVLSYAKVKGLTYEGAHRKLRLMKRQIPPGVNLKPRKGTPRACRLTYQKLRERYL